MNDTVTMTSSGSWGMEADLTAATAQIRSGRSQAGRDSCTDACWGKHRRGRDQVVTFRRRMPSTASTPKRAPVSEDAPETALHPEL
ncbi:MAG: hypothetical protein ACI8S6_000178 [Myxococcota bacterium]|jgi:hypothetical protein